MAQLSNSGRKGVDRNSTGDRMRRRGEERKKSIIVRSNNSISTETVEIAFHIRPRSLRLSEARRERGYSGAFLR